MPGGISIQNSYWHNQTFRLIGQGLKPSLNQIFKIFPAMQNT